MRPAVLMDVSLRIGSVSPSAWMLVIRTKRRQADLAQARRLADHLGLPAR